MPQRIKTIHVPSPYIQGDDSWVDVKPMTVEQFNQNADIQRRAQQAPADLSEDDLKVWREGLDLEQRTLFADVIAGWNWVDDDGKPLPQPAGNPAVFNSLTMAEAGFIAEAINKSTSIEKKDGKKSKRPF